jgi:hypothetical protein
MVHYTSVEYCRFLLYSGSLGIPLLIHKKGTVGEDGENGGPRNRLYLLGTLQITVHQGEWAPSKL